MTHRLRTVIHSTLYNDKGIRLSSLCVYWHKVEELYSGEHLRDNGQNPIGGTLFPIILHSVLPPSCTLFEKKSFCHFFFLLRFPVFGCFGTGGPKQVLNTGNNYINKASFSWSVTGGCGEDHSRTGLILSDFNLIIDNFSKDLIDNFLSHIQPAFPGEPTGTSGTRGSRVTF